MKNVVSAVTAGALALGLAGAALAQPAPRAGRGMARVMNALQLTDAQRAKVQPILDAHRAAVRDLHQQMRDHRQALKAAAQATNPDPAAVGQAFLALKADRDAAKAQRDTLRAKLATVLTPEQNAKLEGFYAGMRFGRRMRGGAGMGPGAGFAR